MRIRTKLMVILVSLIVITGAVVTVVTHTLATDIVKRQHWPQISSRDRFRVIWRPPHIRERNTSRPICERPDEKSR